MKRKLMALALALSAPLIAIVAFSAPASAGTCPPPDNGYYCPSDGISGTGSPLHYASANYVEFGDGGSLDPVPLTIAPGGLDLFADSGLPGHTGAVRGELQYQVGGNLVLRYYNNSGASPVLISSRQLSFTNGVADHLYLQSDGNVVMRRDSDNAAIWVDGVTVCSHPNSGVNCWNRFGVGFTGHEYHWRYGGVDGDTSTPANGSEDGMVLIQQN